MIPTALPRSLWPERPEQRTPSDVMRSTSSNRRRGRRVAVVVTALGVGLGSGLSVLPAPAHAGPTVQAPAPSVLGIGANGASVREVQQALIARGITVVGGADGVFGPLTRSAVQSFQRSQGLPATGEVDAATAKALGIGGGTASGTGVTGLAIGARGPAVADLQRRLMAAGVTVIGGADGIFGPATQRALQLFQHWNGLKQTGQVNDATAKRLPAGSASEPRAVTSGSGSSGSGYVGLAQGARGDTVRRLQQALINAGIPVVGGADGVFGRLTAAALTEYQRRNGLGQTGKVDSATASRLGLTSSGSGSSGSGSSGSGSSGSGYVGLAQGARGDTVRRLQQALINAGIPVVGGADGVFGRLTAAALTDYQRRNGLGQTGKVDSATASRLGLTSSGSGSSGSGSSGSGSSGSGYVGLAQGARGDTVRRLQQALMETGLVLRGGADGIFGPATAAALKAFQSVNGIPQTGVLTSKGAQYLGLTGAAPSGVVSSAGFAVFGEQGDRVRSLQRALVDAGIPLVGGVDGVFGGATANAIMDFQRRQGLSVTGRVDQQTASRLSVGASAAPPRPSAAGVRLQAFPVEAPCYFGDTWLAPRGGGRTHQGVDIIAKTGQKLYAAIAGTISKVYVDQPGSRAGNGLRIAQADGTYITYLHMDAFATGIRVGTKVTAGQVVGTVGNTGNSATPHLHMEIHPRGGAAINPYPIVKAMGGC